MRPIALLAFLVACQSKGETATADGALVTALEIDPVEVTITSGPDAQGTVQFEAIATFTDGTTGVMEQLVSWDISSQAAGTIDDEGLFLATTENGAITTVTASHNNIVASAVANIIYTETIDDGGGSAEDYDGTPSDTLDWLYPETNVAVPRNVPSLTFMWEEVDGADGYRLTFSTDTTNVTALLTENNYTVEAEGWVAIAATNAGGTVDVEVRAVAGGTLYGSETLTLNVNRLDAQGSIYYWSTTDEGLIKVEISATEGDLFYAPRLNAPTCVACHVIREDRMAVTYGGGGSQYFYTGITELTESNPTELTDRDEYGFYNTMNPDGTLLISTTGDGGLTLWDAQSAEKIDSLDTGELFLTQPDWSPAGDMLAAISVTQPPAECGPYAYDVCFVNGELVVAMIDEDGNLGEFTTLYDPDEMDVDDSVGPMNVFYPSISPDGEWIAFNTGYGNSYDNEYASLNVISIDGGDLIPMDNANMDEQLTNSWPHWGPLPDDDVYWLTFSSKRDYGDMVTDGRPQIWVAAFHPELAEEGSDPSSPAFWLPNQDMETSNHSTFWGP